MLRQYKQTGDEPEGLKYLVLTVDKDGNPRRTRVVDVQRGNPIFEGDCEIRDITVTMKEVENLTKTLEEWLENSGSLEERKQRALELKAQGPLGAQPEQSPNCNLSGLVGGQLDSATWQNYAIEKGMVRRVNYDYSLDRLIINLEECIEFYKWAASIV